MQGYYYKNSDGDIEESIPVNYLKYVWVHFNHPMLGEIPSHELVDYLRHAELSIVKDNIKIDSIIIMPDEFHHAHYLTYDIAGDNRGGVSPITAGKYELVLEYSFDEEKVLENFQHVPPSAYVVGGITISEGTAASSDATASRIYINKWTLSPGFNASATSYNVSVNHDVTIINISAAANHSAAAVTGTGTKTL